MERLSDFEYQDICFGWTLISATGKEGKIIGHELLLSGNFLKLYLEIEWSDGSKSVPLFPDDCSKVLIKR